MSGLRPFHVAVPVDDLAAAREFYVGLLGCTEGRSADDWVDFDLYGHQFVCHLRPDDERERARRGSAIVDGYDVPIPHYGVVLGMDDWRELAERLTDGGQDFIVEPYVRFRGQPGEQGTLFIRDPAGNALEFKGFDNLDRLFAR
jgi:extradiol dioxygenase family protein